MFLLNNKGIYLEKSSDNQIFHNDFKQNKRNAIFKNCNNDWWNNYWSRPRILPKIIFGKLQIKTISIPWYDLDWFPAKRQNIDD